MGALRYGSLLALAALGSLAAAVLFLQAQGVAPRALGGYVAKRSEGHNPAITGAGSWMQARLLGLDRGQREPYELPRLVVGAQPRAAGYVASASVLLIATTDEARWALSHARPGDAITFLPGTYRFSGAALAARAEGAADAPIVVRAARPGTVTIEFDAIEGFAVSGPYWRFENLTIRGACASDSRCEHAFHVTGRAHHFAAVNNTILDFNAHFKVNGSGGVFPDGGLIEGNTLSNTAPRKTSNPVTPIDIVAANDWIIRSNLITDFVKAGGNRISYGGFAKGAAARTIFERNVVVCEQKLQGQPGQRVGLSFGGGGTGKPYCRDGRCITEHEQGYIRDNLIAACSDAGIYVNSAAGTSIFHNTLVDTGGIDVRFPESSALVEGNLVDGAIRSRNGGRVHESDNLKTSIAALYAGWHPVRSLFVAPQEFDFRWNDAPPRRRLDAPTVDLCGKERPMLARYGAFEDFGCVARRTLFRYAATSSSSAAN